MANDKEQGQAEITEILRVRNDHYTHALVKAALVLKEDNQWKNCLASVQLCDGKPGESKSLVYKGFEIHEMVQRPQDVLKLVEGLTTQGQLCVANRVIALKDGRFDRLGGARSVGHRVSSRGPWRSWISSEWPGDQYLFGASRESNPPTDRLVKLGLPAYPDGFTAIDHILGLETRGGRTWDGGVVFFFPDFRARIESVTPGIESLLVKVAVRKLTLQQLVGKVYAKSKDGTTLHRDFGFHTPEEKIDLGLQPDHIYVCILCDPDDQILDEWEYSPFRRPFNTRVKFFTPQDVQQLIAQGEGELVEFKSAKNREELKKRIAESAIAFANKNGGTILVGIDDNGRVEGTSGEGWEDLITQSLRDKCEPPIEPTVHPVVLEDKAVYCLLIPESKNKPHLLIGSGIVYIRAGATDRPATRHELDELYKHKRRIGYPRDVRNLI